MVRIARIALAGALAGGLLLGAVGAVFADYGNTAVYQVEISANATGPQGGGAWLWIELSSDGTGTYAGSDCGHGFGAVADKGDVTWWSDGTTLTINGVVFNGLGGLPVTITTSASFGNSRETIFQVFGIPIQGFAQVQVAP